MSEPQTQAKPWDRPVGLTHASPYALEIDLKIHNWVRSWCGETIRASEDAGIYATCPRCQQRLAELEAMDV